MLIQLGKNGRAKLQVVGLWILLAYSRDSNSMPTTGPQYELFVSTTNEPTQKSESIGGGQESTSMPQLAASEHEEHIANDDLSAEELMKLTSGFDSAAEAARREYVAWLEQSRSRTDSAEPNDPKRRGQGVEEPFLASLDPKSKPNSGANSDIPFSPREGVLFRETKWELVNNDDSRIDEFNDPKAGFIVEEEEDMMAEGLDPSAECPICYEMMELGRDYVMSTCGHDFHETCLQDYIRSQEVSSSDTRVMLVSSSKPCSL